VYYMVYCKHVKRLDCCKRFCHKQPVYQDVEVHMIVVVSMHLSVAIAGQPGGAWHSTKMYRVVQLGTSALDIGRAGRPHAAGLAVASLDPP